MRQFFQRRGRNIKQKSQAVSELAILGALILIAFAAIVSYAQIMNSQQSLQMRAFRRALSKSRSESAVVSYTIVKDMPTIDVGDLVGRPNTNRVSASSTVFALRKDPAFFMDPSDKDERDSREYYEVNGQVYEIAPIKVNIQFADGDYEVWIPAPIRDVEYTNQKQRTGGINKGEDAAAITTTQSGSINTQNTTNLMLENQSVFLAEYLEDLQDEVPQEPWEKRIEMERQSVDFGDYILIAAALIVGSIIDQGGCIPSTTVKAAILAGVSMIASAVIGSVLDQGDSSGTATGVSVESGYRGSDSLGGSMSFSVGSTFSVPH